jgi:hypothetical protein
VRHEDARLAVCAEGARDYGGVPIAVFNDPSDPREVICWADGHVAKSPPPGPGGVIRPEYNRLVFKVTLDGKNLVLIAAGYRSAMPVKVPGGSVP